MSRRILVEQPGLAAELGLGLDSPTLTTFEQEAPPDDQKDEEERRHPQGGGEHPQ